MCYKQQAVLPNKNNNQTNRNEASNVILVAAPMELGLTTDQKHSDTIFIGDSGATYHMRYSSVGMINLTLYQTAVTVGNNETMYGQAQGSFKGTVHNTDGTSFPIILTDILYVPELWLNFFISPKQFKMTLSSLEVPMAS
jgi:hypothetical protein